MGIEERILAKNYTVSSDTWRTGRNNNDLIIGPSGSGKTRGYVKPNILQCSGSMVVADTKGSLIGEVGNVLREEGYRIIHMNFKDLGSSYGYNPLDYIRYDRRTGSYSAQDIMTIATALTREKTTREPYWDYAARMYLTSLIAYVMEALPKREHTMKYVTDLLDEIGSGNYAKLMEEHRLMNPGSFAVRTYRLFSENQKAEKMHASILGILGEKLQGLTFHEAERMFNARKRLDFRDLGREKCALFLTISDTDRSMDRLISLFYTQAMHVLCDSADRDYPDHRLPEPVRFVLDDFATNACIPDFANLSSVIRSREISVSIILQSITQLRGMYGEADAATIISNCDHCLYLGGQDVETARLMAVKANKAASTILNMPLDQAYLFARGAEPRRVEKYDLRDHPRYQMLPEAGGATEGQWDLAG